MIGLTHDQEGSQLRQFAQGCACSGFGDASEPRWIWSFSKVPASVVSFASADYLNNISDVHIWWDFSVGVWTFIDGEEAADERDDFTRLGTADIDTVKFHCQT
jgi:hypothetical protein